MRAQFLPSCDSASPARPLTQKRPSLHTSQNDNCAVVSGLTAVVSGLTLEAVHSFNIWFLLLSGLLFPAGQIIDCTAVP